MGLSLLMAIVMAPVACGGHANSLAGDTGNADARTDASPGDGGTTKDATDAGPSCNSDERTRVERGRLAVDTEVRDLVHAPCTEDEWRFSAAAGSTIQVTLSVVGLHHMQASVTLPDATELTAPLASLSNPGGMAVRHMTFTPSRSGEFVLLVATSNPEATETYSLAIDCLDHCELVTTRYPIVLVHGWTGFDQVGPLVYFYGVKDALEQAGFLVYTANLDPYNSVKYRSEELEDEVLDFLRESHSDRVNLVAHSQGGLDSRRLISTLGFGDRVSALVTIATPHHGTPIADIAMGDLPGPTDEALDFLLNLLGATTVQSRSDAKAAFKSMTTDFVQNEFNPANPNDPRVTYISWTGLTCPLGVRCGDVCDVEIRWSYDLIYLNAGDNDGIVPVESAKWGDFRGLLPADHFDEVGQLFGVTGPNFHHLDFYLSVAKNLAASGH
ncbi:MAG: triacylglycerol lipase [Deltaproteobacteria bacterium]|nr:triacylglycerol lipase [Deltaproteobacteria bacterium]